MLDSSSGVPLGSYKPEGLGRLALSGICGWWLYTCIQVIDLEFDLGQKSVLSFSFGLC